MTMSYGGTMYPSSKKGNPNAITTNISDGTEITGDVSFKDTMRIDGQFDGNLNGDHLIISSSGRVLGDVVANSCVCYGQIVGNLTLERLQVKQGGKIDGTVTTVDLEVESGAVLIGEIRQPKKELRLVGDDNNHFTSEMEKENAKM